MFSYNYRNGYALLSYMEYPIILAQELVLVYLVIYYKGLIGWLSFIMAGLYFFMAGGFLLGFLPREALMFLVVGSRMIQTCSYTIFFSVISLFVAAVYTDWSVE